MSNRQRPDQNDQRYQYKDSKRSKTPTEIDVEAINDGGQKKRNFEQNEYKHFDQQYAPYNQSYDKPNDATLQRRLVAVEEKMAQYDSVHRHFTILDRKVEELALQFDRYVSNDRGKSTMSFSEQNKADADPRIKVVEEKFELINNKLDNGLLILSRDLQEYQRMSQKKIKEAIEEVVGPSLQDIGEALKSQSMDIEDLRINTNQNLQSLQNDFYQRLLDTQDKRFSSTRNLIRNDPMTPERDSPYLKQKLQSHEQSGKNLDSGRNDGPRSRTFQTSDLQEQKVRNVRLSEEQEFEQERVLTEKSRMAQHPIDQHLKPSNQSSNAHLKKYDNLKSNQPQGEFRNKNQSFADDQELRYDQQSDFDETRRKIDDEINRRLMEENERRRNILQKENDQMKGEQQSFINFQQFSSNGKFKHTPLSTEKSRSKEIQNRLLLERKTKQEKINQLNEYSQYKKK